MSIQLKNICDDYSLDYGILMQAVEANATVIIAYSVTVRP